MKILIAGAGPTGLTAAIELARRGIIARVIDKKAAPSPLSRAVGIHANSLALMEASGVTALLLAEGIKTTRAHFHLQQKDLATFDISLLRHRYNFILALPQNRTEEIMRGRLEALGGRVEFNTALQSLSFPAGGKCRALIEPGGEEDFDIVIGAEGLHSKTREAAGISMPGYEYPDLWSIADFDCADMPWPKDELHLFFQEEGKIALLIRIGAQRYRAIASTPEALKRIPGNFSVSKTNDSSTFHISVRQAPIYQKGPVFIAGDAAHVHSPAGARGMNLGIEDACCLARRIAAGDTAGYTAERHPVGAEAIRLTETMIRAATSKNPLTKFLRNAGFITIAHIPALQRILAEKIAGLR